MNMLSTRGANTARSYTDVLLEGLAPDGGLFVPSEYPRFSPAELAALKSAPYTQIAFEVKRKLIGGAIPDETLRTMIDDAYSEKNFAHTEGEVVPAGEIGNGLWLQNLSLGPTAAFKDMAMQLLGREMAYELSRRKESLGILGATSGDTGSAAEAAFKGLSGITLVMLSPLEGMSDFQRAQMGSLSGGNIANISVRGRFDDCQDLVKAIKQDPAFSKLGAVNSINWARIASQIPYYFSGYFQIAKNIGDEIDVTVPSGNFGNVLSGYIAKQMGLPLRRLIVATNENNVLHTLFSTGVYEMMPAQITSSPSMDISKASNYERLAFDIFDRDPARTEAYMKQFNMMGHVSLSDFGVSMNAFRDRGFESGTSSHHNRLDTIRKIYADAGTVIDPHTADGVFVGTEKRAGIPMLCLATALPVKFEETIREALGFVPERPARFVGLEKNVADDAFAVIDADPNTLTRLLHSLKVSV